MSLVVDVSALIGRAMPDESNLDLGPALISHDEVLAPWLLWVELRNILLVSERRRRLPAGMVEQLLGTFDALAITHDTSPDSAVVIDLARRHSLTADDAVYLETALRHGANLASLDLALLRAPAAENVPVLG